MKETVILTFLFLISSSCKTSKTAGENDLSIPKTIKLFQAIPENPVVLKIQQHTYPAPIGGHLQGIQQLDKKHLVISGSSYTKAYFFIAKMKGITRIKRRGIISKMIYINDDFPNMGHNHASGIQVLDNLLAIGTEGGGDSIKSSIIFYDLTNPDDPKPFSVKINRQEDTAGAIGLTTIGDSVLLAVGGWDSNRIDFYLTNKPTLNTSLLDFKLFKTWRTESRNTTDWTDPKWGTYQSLNFLKDEKGILYLIGFYQDMNEQHLADLYQVFLKNEPSTLLIKMDTKKLSTKEGASFKNGAGLSTIKAPKRFNLLATERNWNTLIRVNYW